VFELDFAARVDRGLVRETNQDVARVVPGLNLALVADGMGGHDDGDIASRTAADALEEGFGRMGGAGADADQTANRLRACFLEANHHVAARSAHAWGVGRMGTTLVAAVFAHRQVIIGNVGDSRCYRLRDGRLESLTQDHSYAAHMARSGMDATPEGREVAAQWAHALIRCVNGDENLNVDTHIYHCEPGDIYLLCSDGLWGSVSDGAVVSHLLQADDMDDACQRLIGAAWAGGGLDNIGIAVVRLHPLHARLDDPSLKRQAAESSHCPSQGA
jgi:PPM family protein phosphatase